jgi:hypothetical protein
VFNTNCELIGIHTGGYSEPGAEERSAHVSFAVPIERVVELMADSDMAAPVDLSAEPVIPVGEGGAETFTLAAFLEPLLDSSETFLGAHGALTTTARRCGIASVAPAELARTELVEASLAEIARQPIGVGTAVRMIATRIDQTDAFDVGQHANVRERIPWFVVPSEAVAPIAFAEGAAEEGLGSI